LTCGVALACAASVQFGRFPPPRQRCADEDDVRRLAELLPVPERDSVLAAEIERLAERFVYSAAYCRTGERRLR
jgi:hypothetical protein